MHHRIRRLSLPRRVRAPGQVGVIGDGYGSDTSSIEEVSDSQGHGGTPAGHDQTSRAPTPTDHLAPGIHDQQDFDDDDQTIAADTGYYDISASIPPPRLTGLGKRKTPHGFTPGGSHRHKIIKFDLSHSTADSETAATPSASASDTSQTITNRRRVVDYRKQVQRQSFSPSGVPAQPSPSTSANCQNQSPIDPIPPPRRRKMMTNLPEDIFVTPPPGVVASTGSRGGSVPSTSQPPALTAPLAPMFGAAHEVTPTRTTEIPQAEPQSEIPTAEPPGAEPEMVLRLVCGWNDETNTYLYRDEVVNPPPIYGDGPERVPKRPKKASAKAKLSRDGDAKTSNVSARANEKMEKSRRERADRRGKNATPRQQPSPASTPSYEPGHQSHKKRARSPSGSSESSDSDEDSSDEVDADRQRYVVPGHLQGTVRPVPRPESSDEMAWTDMKITTVPLPDYPTVKIGGFDNIMVTLVSPDNEKPHNEPAKVLDCRLHPDGTYFLLVSWWVERRTLSKSLVGFKRYLDRRWPVDSPFQFVLGCHFDVITMESVTEKMADDERFCNSMVYGGVTHNCELFSNVPDEMERRECIKNGAKGDERLVEEQKQKSLFRMLLRPEMKGK